MACLSVASSHLGLILLAVEGAVLLAQPAARPPQFLLHRIGTDNSEGVAVMDMDSDGKLDVTSGAYWYRYPDWRRTEFREAAVFGEFVANCGEFAIDVNRDGAADIITASWFENGIFYFENPRQPGARWQKRVVTPSTETEGLIAVDVDGDGALDIVPSHYSEQPVFWIQNVNGELRRRPVSPRGNGHGVGYGDVDGDGRNDIILANGWHRQIDVAADRWEFLQEFQLGAAGIPIFVYDVNQDGLNDLIFGKGHDVGLFWLEQRRDESGHRTWAQHEIDMTYSQLHTLQMADLDGDGKPELIAGKRYRGHGPSDPGAYDPLAIYYYILHPGPEPRFERHPIAFNSQAGAGMQFVVVDLDGDGDLDIICGGKTGQFWFENLSVNKAPDESRELLWEYGCRIP